MQIDTSQISARMSEKIEALLVQRREFMTAVSDIDAQLNTAFRALGLDPTEFGVAVGSRLPPPQFNQPNQYPLNPNTMGAHMLDILLNAQKGYGRLELRHEIAKDPRYGAQIEKSMNGYYNLINRYLQKGRIVEVENNLYHPDRAPLSDGEDDPTGKHLQSNVSTLFPDKQANHSDD